MRLEGEVVIVGPVVFLIGQSRPVEYPSFQCDRKTAAEGPRRGGSDVAYVADLLGDKGAVGEVLQVGRPMGIYSERHAHLAERELERLFGLQPDICVEHLDRALVREVNLSFISYNRDYFPFYAQAGVAYFKPPFPNCRLVFVFCPDCAVYFGLIAMADGGFLGGLRAGTQGDGACGASEHGGDNVLAHNLMC